MDTEKINEILNPAAQNAARMFSPYTTAGDILNDLWVYVLENQAYVTECMNDTEESGAKRLRTAISTQARVAGQKAKAQACGYSVDDVMTYSIKALESLLPDSFDYEDWQSFGQHGDGQPTAKGLANMTGDRIAEFVDISAALKGLPERAYNVLVWKYKYGLTDEAVGEELKVTRQAASKAKDQALRALQSALGPKPYDDAPERRTVRSNASWRAAAAHQYDGS